MEKLGVKEKRYVPISWGLKASAQYLASVIVDGIWLVSIMVDGKYKYLKMSALQQNIVTSQFMSVKLMISIIF